jgi:TonB family protein
MRCVIPVLFLFTTLAAAPDDAIRIGPGVQTPRLRHKQEPTYPPDALAQQVQGTVVFQLIIDEKGRPTDIHVISPLGFGLDERAQAAIEKWEFDPGTKNGKPVRIWCTIEVNFRLLGRSFDEDYERKRTAYNSAAAELKSSVMGRKEHAITTIQNLAKQQFPAAQYIVGLWKMRGEHGDQNLEEGIALLQKAAAKNYGPAMYEIGYKQVRGEDLPLDADKGLELLRRASMLGSTQAQFYLGNRYEKGDGVPVELDRARRYFRLCAATGTPLCQLRLAILILSSPDRPERDLVQAIAWLQFAAEKLPEAREFLDRESATLTAAQLEWAGSLKKNLLRK